MRVGYLDGQGGVKSSGTEKQRKNSLNVLRVLQKQVRKAEK